MSGGENIAGNIGNFHFRLLRCIVKNTDGYENRVKTCYLQISVRTVKED